MKVVKKKRSDIVYTSQILYAFYMYYVRSKGIQPSDNIVVCSNDDLYWFSGC